MEGFRLLVQLLTALALSEAAQLGASGWISMAPGQLLWEN